MVRVPAAGPAVVGLKETLIVQLPALATGVPTQLLVCTNGPVTVTLATLSEVLFALSRVTTAGETLVWPTIKLPKLRRFADRPTPLPTPVRFTV